MSPGVARAGGNVCASTASCETFMLIRLPLSVFVATLVMACTPQAKPVAVADKTPVADKAAVCQARCLAEAGASAPAARPRARPAPPRVHRVSDQPRGLTGTGRVARDVYVPEGPRGGAYGGAYGVRYAGSSVVVTESASSSAGYRYSESEERFGSRGAVAAPGAGYAYGGASAASGRESRYGPPPATAHPPHRPTGQLAGITRDGALTWPGKVAY